MTLAVLALAAGLAGGPGEAAPAAVTVATARGEVRVPVRTDRGHPVIPASPLFGFLPITAELRSGWAVVRFAAQPFRFLLDAPAFVDGARVVPLAGGAYVARDTLFVPLQWLTDYIPRRFSEGYRYDPYAARFEEAGIAPVVRSTPGGDEAPAGTGLRSRHRVTVDAGHGGRDPGARSPFFPRGVTEKDVALGIARRLHRELERRGIDVIMTRTKDTLIALDERAGYCAADCDLFVSIHVDALSPRRGYQEVSGIHTYFLGEALTAEARRVATLENEALRYEAGRTRGDGDPLGFIFRDLQTNELLRESAQLANLIQSASARVHPGRDRGVNQARFRVLASAQRPAVLVETGYGTNRRDARFLTSESGQEQLARAIADGIVDYLRRYEDKTGVGVWR